MAEKFTPHTVTWTRLSLEALQGPVVWWQGAVCLYSPSSLFPLVMGQEQGTIRGQNSPYASVIKKLYPSPGDSHYLLIWLIA